MKVSANVILIFCVSVILLIAVSVSLQLPDNFCRGEFSPVDANSYRQTAEMLYCHQFQPHPIRPFGYPLIIGIPFLFGASDMGILVFAVFLNIIFWLATVVLLYFIVRRLVNPASGLCASILYVLCISHEISLYQSLSETMFLFLIFLSLHFFLRYLFSLKSGDLLFALGALCYSVVVRPVTYYFALLAVVCCLILFFRRRSWRNICAVAGMYLATMGLQSINMHRAFGTFQQSYVQNYTLHAYLMSLSEFLNQKENTSFPDFHAKRQAKTDSVMISFKGSGIEHLQYADDFYKAAVKKNFATNKWNIVRAIYINAVSNMKGGSPSLIVLTSGEGDSGFESRIKAFTKVTRWENKFSCYLGILCLPLFVILPFFRRYKPDGSYLFVAGVNVIFLYLLATSGISFWQGDRFTYILQPLVIVTVFFTGNILKREIVAGYGRSSTEKSTYSPE
jgi:hypothetical protein